MVASYRLGSSGEQQEGQFSTGASLFTPAGLAVSPRSVAGTVSSAHPTFSAWVGGDPGAPVQVVFTVNGEDVATVQALTGTRVEYESSTELSGSITWSVTATVDADSQTATGAPFQIDTGVVCVPAGGASR